MRLWVGEDRKAGGLVSAAECGGSSLEQTLRPAPRTRPRTDRSQTGFPPALAAGVVGASQWLQATRLFSRDGVGGTQNSRQDPCGACTRLLVSRSTCKPDRDVMLERRVEGAARHSGHPGGRRCTSQPWSAPHLARLRKTGRCLPSASHIHSQMFNSLEHLKQTGLEVDGG